VPLVTRIAIGASSSVPSMRRVTGARERFLQPDGGEHAPAGRAADPPRAALEPRVDRGALEQLVQGAAAAEHLHPERIDGRIEVLGEPHRPQHRAEVDVLRAHRHRELRHVGAQIERDRACERHPGECGAERRRFHPPAAQAQAHCAVRQFPAREHHPLQADADVRVGEVDAVREDRHVERAGRLRLPGAGWKEALQLRHVDERAAHGGDDDRLLADAGAVCVDHDLAPAEPEPQVLEVPLVALDSRAAADRDRRVRVWGGAQPAREVARAPPLQPEREVGAARRLGAGEDAGERERHAGAAHLEIDRRARRAQHPRGVAAAQAGGHALARERAARGAAQALAPRDRDVERVEHELYRASARHVAVGELRLRHRELQLEIERERAERFPAAGDFQVESAERAVDAGKAGDHFREPAERRALRAQLERDRRHRRRAVEIEAPGQRHVADGRLERRAEAAVLDAHLELRVAHVAGEPEPAGDAQLHVGVRDRQAGEIDRLLLDRRVGRRLRLAGLRVFVGEEGPHVERRHLELAGDARAFAGERDLEMTGQIGRAHHAADAADRRLVRARSHARREAGHADLRQPGLQQPLELGEVLGA
jgi:hypothetical protein